MLALVALCGCQVRGLVGSNETAPGSGDGGSSADNGGADEGGNDTASSVSNSGTTTDGGSESGSDDTMQTRWDVGPMDVPELCAPPPTRVCDADDNEWHHAMGFACDGEYDATFSANVLPEAVYVQEGQIGTSGVFAPVSGEKMVVLSSGRASELPMSLPDLIAANPGCDGHSCPSTSLAGALLEVLPEPIKVRRVSESGVDCYEDPQLVGEGDCSNSLWDNWIAGFGGAYDYSELRVRAIVPPTVTALEYRFAFFSSEYPIWTDHDSENSYNDMYVAWLESEAWTGNISFDEEGNPISVNSVLLDYTTPSASCPTCEAPELAGFSMEQHAGTKWLTTRAPVQPGEEIELIFAIFDMSDAGWDSMVILDGFEWTCADGPPLTWAG